MKINSPSEQPLLSSYRIFLLVPQPRAISLLSSPLLSVWSLGGMEHSLPQGDGEMRGPGPVCVALGNVPPLSGRWRGEPTEWKARDRLRGGWNFFSFRKGFLSQRLPRGINLETLSPFKNMTPNLRVNFWLGSNYTGLLVPLGEILTLTPRTRIAPLPNTNTKG